MSLQKTVCLCTLLAALPFAAAPEAGATDIYPVTDSSAAKSSGEQNNLREFKIEKTYSGNLTIANANLTGLNGSAEANYNKGILTASGSMTGNFSLYGGYAHGDNSSRTSENRVTLEATGNELVFESGSTINRSTRFAYIYAGYAMVSYNETQSYKDIKATYNKIIFKNGTNLYCSSSSSTSLTIMGGRSQGYSNAESNKSLIKSEFNNVKINDGVIYKYDSLASTKIVIQGGIAGIYGYGTAQALNNTVEITNLDTKEATWTSRILGGSATSYQGTANAVAKLNHVYLTLSSSLALAYDDSNYIQHVLCGGAALGFNDTEASENTVELNGGIYKSYVSTNHKNVAGGVIGGYSYGSRTVKANGNQVAIKGGTYECNIYGGFSAAKDETGTSEANNNVISLEKGTNDITFGEKSVIWGGYTEVNGIEKGTTTGNTLKLCGVQNIEAANIKNFDNLYFEVPAMQADGTVLTLTGKNDDNDKTTNLSGATVEVKVCGNLTKANGNAFDIGDKVYLLTNENGLTVDKIDLSKEVVTASTGISFDYKLKVKTQDTDGKTTSLVLVLTDEPADTGDDDDTDGGSGKKTPSNKTFHQETKAIAEGAAAGLALVNESVNTSIEMARSFSMPAGSIAPFVHAQGSSVTHETGSSVHLNSVSLVAGIGTGLDAGAGNLSLGAFFEYGKGSYTTSNSFDNGSNVNGDGDAWYMGGGLLAKMDFLRTGPGHFYVEGSAHMGQLHNEYDSKDLHDVTGRVAKFDMDSPYYSLHGGLGYVWNITEDHDVDVYGNYIWTRVQGTDDTLTTGDKFEYDDMDSSRVRFGARYTYKGNERFRPYIGAAWEHEFAGSCESTSFGHPVAAPSFEGDSGMGELGLAMTPSEALPLTINLGVQGYVGQKRGVSGNCSLAYEF